MAEGSLKPRAEQRMAVVDHEARAGADQDQALRLWLRMLSCTSLIERQVRSNLRREFDTTLPRFDLMAHLDRSPEGLRMGDLSRRMMVTSGNVTGITDQLEAEGLVMRVFSPEDRRSLIVRMTPERPAGFPADGEGLRALDRWDVRQAAATRSKPVAQAARYAQGRSARDRSGLALRAGAQGSVIAGR